MARAKKTPGKSLVAWEEQLAQEANIASKMEERAVGGGQNLSVRGGMFSVGGNEIGDSIQVVVVDHILENTYYAGRFDPNNPQSPACYAFGRNEDDLAPHERAGVPQCETCEGCDNNKFGSADTGRGKACKNTRKLAVITVDDMENIEDAEIAMLRIPVTSVKSWANYVQKVASTMKRPPLGVITQIDIVDDPKSQFKLSFKVVEEVSGDKIEALFAKRKEVEAELFAPYPEYEEQPAPARGGRGGGRNQTTPRGKASAAAPAPAKGKAATARKKF